jgi:hypothetical protein
MPVFYLSYSLRLLRNPSEIKTKWHAQKKEEENEEKKNIKFGRRMQETKTGCWTRCQIGAQYSVYIAAAVANFAPAAEQTYKWHPSLCRTLQLLEEEEEED